MNRQNLARTSVQMRVIILCMRADNLSSRFFSSIIFPFLHKP